MRSALLGHIPWNDFAKIEILSINSRFAWDSGCQTSGNTNEENCKYLHISE
jgi:hypothetical protein